MGKQTDQQSQRRNQPNAKPSAQAKGQTVKWPQSWQGKAVTVLGLSKSGSAVARYVARRGGDVFLSESVPASPANEVLRNELQALGVTVEMGGHSAQCYSHSDLVVTSPGIPPTGSILEQLKISGKQIISEVELAYRESQQLSPPVPIIGITGTNGKSTTTALISEILTHAGLNAPDCGNIGLPLLTVLDAVVEKGTAVEQSETVKSGKPLDYLVAELSSFQLEFSPTLRAKIAVFTNLRPDHLDWHGSLDAYQKAKLKLFTGEQSPEWAVINRADALSQTIAHQTRGQILAFAVDPNQVAGFENRAYLTPEGGVTIALKGQSPLTLFNVRELQIIGNHNYENVLASVAVAHLLGLSADQIREACLAFTGLEHRLERVPAGETDLRFYNDSKATNPDSSVSALKAFPEEQVVLIAGGYDKNTSLEEFVTEVKAHAHAVVLLGNAKERFHQALSDAGFYHITTIETGENALKEAIEQAVLHAREHVPAYPILFSPACASFDMFKNYEERGHVFKQLVQDVVRDMQSPKTTVRGAR